MIALGAVENLRVHSAEPKQSLEWHQLPLINHVVNADTPGFTPTIRVTADGDANEDAPSELKM